MADNRTVEKLISMKKEIDEAKEKRAEVKGRLAEIYDNVKKEFDCSDLKEALQKLDDLDKQYKDKKGQLEKGVKALEKKYEWS